LKRRDIGTIAGYTICFISGDEVRQITEADEDDVAIEQMLNARYGKVEILARTARDSRVLRLLRLERDDFMDWFPGMRRMDKRYRSPR
jgi:hypothetical protein